MPVQNAEIAAMFDPSADLLEIEDEEPHLQGCEARWVAAAKRASPALVRLMICIKR